MTVQGENKHQVPVHRNFPFGFALLAMRGLARPPRSLMASANQTLLLQCLILTKSPLGKLPVIAPPRIPLIGGGSHRHRKSSALALMICDIANQSQDNIRESSLYIDHLYKCYRRYNMSTYCHTVDGILNHLLKYNRNHIPYTGY